MKSILQKDKRCYICGLYYPTEEHHTIFGTANRKISEQNGFKVYLCKEHHTGTIGVHGKYGHSLDLRLKEDTEKAFLRQGHSINEWMKLVGKNYLK